MAIDSQMKVGKSNRCGLLLLPLAVCEEGKRGKVHRLLGNKGKDGGSGKSIGSWVMKRKDISWLLGDKGEGGGICLHLFALKLNTLIKNMTINQCVPDCGLGRPGEGAVACRSRGKI